MNKAKDIKDYLHLYLGCDVWHINPIEPHAVTLTSWRLNDILGGVLSYDLHKLILRPLSDMTEEEVNECWKILEWSEMITTPKLRRQELNNEFLDSDEGRECGWFSFLKILPYLLKQRFDLFGLIESGLAIDKTKITSHE